MHYILPSPTNLHRWGLADMLECHLCQKRGTLEHILSCCSNALPDRRYHWCIINQVLRPLADTVSKAITNSKYQNTHKQSVTFVSAGKKAQQQPNSSKGLLTTAWDWKHQVDLGRKHKFPEHISATTTTSLPRHGVNIRVNKPSGSGRAYCPMGRTDWGANEHTRAKYNELVMPCRSKGRKACGFAGQSLHRTLKLLGIRERSGVQESHKDHCRGSRESLKMAVDP